MRRLAWLFGLFCWTSAASACAQQAEEGPWVASTRGEVYYWAECSAAERLSPGNRIYFETAEEARRAGYRPSAARGCQGPSASATTAPMPAQPRRGAESSKALPPSGDTRICTIERVSDGDSLVCESGEKVRLLLIDTPEKDQAPWGERARSTLRDLVPPGTQVRLETDVQAKDRYGRTLAYVWLPDGRMANELMARRGYAVPLVYPPNVKYIDRIRAAVAEAQRERRGFWSTSAFECLPRDFRAGRCE